MRSSSGSSPLTRGKPTWTRSWGRTSRLIPAHAGKTMASYRSRQDPRAHPRSRGENIQTTVQTVAGWGSSPLTRGKPTGVRMSDIGFPAHPRSRGENVLLAERAGIAAGSSPLTRGKHDPRAQRSRPRRLIPAHAGKTVMMTSASGRRPAHPRSRGENVHAPTSAPSGYGSSPLTRGKRVPPQGHGEAEGLIPAHAGKTPSPGAREHGYAAHPRSRGENCITSVRMTMSPGSSPLTRGKLRRGDKLADAGRLIPAHAGKTGH